MKTNHGHIEATIIINGTVITESQATTIRVTLESFSHYLVHEGLGDGEHGKRMAEIYSRDICEIRKIMYK